MAGARDDGVRRPTDRLVLHAGMSKAGSSSVQKWIEAHADIVRSAGVEPMVARMRGSSLRVVSYEDRNISSWTFVRAYIAHHDRGLLDELRDQVTEAMERHGSVVLSCEGFGSLIAAGDEGFLECLEQLGQRVPVEVAYYVRPQHTSLEAAWRQWGFRSGRSPSTYLGRRAARLHYDETRERFTTAAPSVAFTVRPFRDDLLDHGNVVADFARRFVGIAELPDGTRTWWSNRGLPLDLANLLRHAPEGLFFTDTSADAQYLRLKDYAEGGWTAADSAHARLSRLVLQQWCHEQFEPGNQRLLARVDWATESFVPPLDVEAWAAVADRPITLDTVAALWEPTGSEAERRRFFVELTASLAPPSRRPGGTGRWLRRARTGFRRLS